MISRKSNLSVPAFLAVVCLIAVSFVTHQKKIVIYSAGDSTMSDKDTTENNPGRGWMQMFPSLLNKDAVVYNYASGGQSSKSFIARGRWTKIMDQVKPGDYVFIQFGHNDPKPDTGRHTDAETTFKSNMVKFVTEARNKGAQPVLFTSIVRRVFNNDGTLRDTHGAYVTVVRDIAKEMHVPLVDLNISTEKLIREMGPEDSKKLFIYVEPGVSKKLPNGSKDNTHLNVYGGTRVAQLAAEGIKALKLPLAAYFK